MINFQIYKTHIKPQKPTLIKPIKPAGLGFMIKPGFYANPDRNGQCELCYKGTILQRNSRKMTIKWSFSFNSFVNLCGQKFVSHNMTTLCQNLLKNIASKVSWDL